MVIRKTLAIIFLIVILQLTYLIFSIEGKIIPSPFDLIKASMELFRTKTVFTHIVSRHMGSPAVRSMDNLYKKSYYL